VKVSKPKQKRNIMPKAQLNLQGFDAPNLQQKFKIIHAPQVVLKAI
jgi:hypothetical protein